MLQLAAVFTDHMVLQAEKPAAVFGRADAPVTAAIGGVTASAVPANGTFTLRLPPLPYGGPWELTVACGSESIVLHDVMAGEVWICGGQSNMEFRLCEEKHFDTMNTVSDPMIRLYETPVAATAGEAELLEKDCRWQPLAAGQSGSFSAISVFAALEMRKRLREAGRGDIAVGLLVCCLGGTSASSWISRDTLMSFGTGRDYIRDFEQRVGGKTDEQYRTELAAYERTVQDYNDRAAAVRAAQPDIEFGALTDLVGLYPWPPPDGPLMPRRPHCLYDFMLRRISPYTVRGVYWYQGETDSAHRWASGYAGTFRALIADWRAAFEDAALPFVAAQLPGFDSDPAGEDWTAIRTAQLDVADTDPAVYLACLIDCGEHDNIHPTDKLTPGSRMAALALAHVYGLPLRADAPRFVRAVQSGDLLTLYTADAGDLCTVSSGSRFPVSPAAAVIACRPGAVTLRMAAPADTVVYAEGNDPLYGIADLHGLPCYPFRLKVIREEAQL